MLRNWLKIAFTNYKKNWLSTVINLFGLAIGLSSFMLILIHWQDEESFENWNPKKENIYFFQGYYKKDNVYGNNTSYLVAKRAKDIIPEIEDYVLINGSGYAGVAVSDKKSAYIEGGMSVSPSFFKLFPFKILSGNGEKALLETNSIAISNTISQELFGTTDAVGKTLTYENNPLVVTAVYELPKDNTEINPDFLFLSKQYANSVKDPGDAWGNNSYGCFFLFKDDASTEVVRRKVVKDIFEYRAKMFVDKGMSAEKYLELYGPNDVEFTPLDKMKLHAKASWFGGGDYKLILILFSLSVLLLLMSAINFINLKTAQASQRAKEIGVRKALGSGKLQLIVQFLLETFIITFAAYLLSLALTEAVLPFFGKFLNKEIHFQNDFYLYSAIIVIAISLLSGIIPALYLSNFKAIDTLKGNFARSKNGIWLRNSILGLQLVISSFFIIGSFIINDQVTYMMNKDLGFDGSQLYTINFNQDSKKPWMKYELLKSELKKIEGVKSVTFGEALPGFNGRSSSNVDWHNESVEAQHCSLDFGFLEAMKIKLLAGRFFSPKLSSDTINSAIVNEAFVRKFGWKNNEAFDNQVSPGFDTVRYNIVGIVKDFNVFNPRAEIEPMIFFHYKETEWKRYNLNRVILEFDPNNMLATQERVKEYWEKYIEPGYPFNGEFINKKFAKTFVKYQKQQTLFTILNTLVLIVALLGLFALSSLMIEQKLKDVAIKKTLGASSSVLIKDLTRKFLWITFIAVLVSIPVSYYFMNEWLKDFAYRIEMPWWPYLLSLVILLALTFFVVSIKAYRATKIELVKYLKYE
ncbi:TPA: FtsX-like permease family protein [Elizabethkingia anophelis]|nr:FtsX-like permease family protein [Elizabethkingia anophelis]HAY3512373.1 FtsX-like permease family protein [Elizabethkingia anophelis]HAY3524210.1 FtsX-like permease family protein [Elizabethkingia anophelis]HAY3528296.1 FtsX-like permease family protein [Elizabethkingia anophelis]HAY3532162.1 FtsX-like permease family protein [Elizabethkingia anophelis]